MIAFLLCDNATKVYFSGTHLISNHFLKNMPAHFLGDHGIIPTNPIQDNCLTRTNINHCCTRGQLFINIVSRDMTKPTKWVCAQWRFRSAWASAQSDQSLRCAFNGQLRTQAFFMRTAKTLIRLGGCPGWFKCSLGAHSLCWFCYVAAHILTHSFSSLQNSIIGFSHRKGGNRKLLRESSNADW